MEIFLFNLSYMWLNAFLALVAVAFGWLMSRANSIFAKVWTGFIWLIFLPNTIYIVTDFSHLPEQWSRVNTLFKFILIAQYSLFSAFGIMSFLISVYFFQKLMEGKYVSGKTENMKASTFVEICVLNFAVGIAVIMGGIERTNSWYVLTDPIRVLRDAFSVVLSSEKLMLSVGIGIFANTIYFLMFKYVANWEKKYFGK